MLRRLFLLTFIILAAATPVQARPYQHTLCAAAIFQDEAPYLKEWIEYHHLLGVEHFYLYNNYSSDNYLEVLWPYLETGLVSLVDWPKYDQPDKNWDTIQCEAYQDAVERSTKTSKWLALLDIDEFFVPVEDNNLPRLLERFENTSVGGICGIWVCFGTSGVAKIPNDQLLIETLLLNGGKTCEGDASAIWNHGHYKSIVRPDRVLHAVSPHYCLYKPSYGHTMLGLDLLQINHYWTRDEWFLYNFKIPRRKKWGQSESTVIKRASSLNLETEYSKSILRFVSPVREKVFTPSPPVDL